jgi:hypothetical protein
VVNKQTDKYYIYSKDLLRANESFQRKSGAPSVEINPMTVSNDTYFCDKFAAKIKITDDDKANADNPIRLKEHGAKKLKNKMMRKKEVDMATNLFNVTTFAGKTTAVVAADRWNAATSEPITQILDYKETMRKNCGYNANTLILGAEVAKSLKTHPQFTNNYLSSNVDKDVTLAKMAAAFGVKRVIVGEEIQNTAAEGATASNAFIWGKYALLAHIADSPMIDEPSLIYSFRWNMGKGGSELVKEWRDEELESDFIEYTLSYDDKVIATDLGYLLSTVVD